MNLIPEIKPEQSLELLKELHILTRDLKINQDTRRKLKQVYHLYHFIEPLLEDVFKTDSNPILVDHGAGKSYLGFILYDLFFKNKDRGHVYGIETRSELIKKSIELAERLKYPRMKFLNLSVEESTNSKEIPETVSIVTALHACDTATDDALKFGLLKKAKHIVLVPCCQAYLSHKLKNIKTFNLKDDVFTEIYRHAIHTREFGSHLTNVLRSLILESHGYQVTVTELVGWEHSMKNELIVATFKNLPTAYPKKRLNELIEKMHLTDLEIYKELI